MARSARSSRWTAEEPWMHPAASNTAKKVRRMRTPFAGAPAARQETSNCDARQSPSATPLSRTAPGGPHSMLALALLLAAPAEELQVSLRHLEAAAAAWAPAPSPDGTRVAFLTTLFGTRQAASVSAGGGYPIQLTDEPEGANEVRCLPPEAKQLVVTVLRDGRRRLLLVSEDGSAAVPVDADAGDQLLGGFARDGKKIFYAVQSGEKVSLRTFVPDTRKSAELTEAPAAAGHHVAAGSLPLREALAGLFALGPPSLDGRSIVALVRRAGSEAVVVVDLGTARA